MATCGSVVFTGGAIGAAGGAGVEAAAGAGVAIAGFGVALKGDGRGSGGGAAGRLSTRAALPCTDFSGTDGIGGGGAAGTAATVCRRSTAGGTLSGTAAAPTTRIESSVEWPVPKVSSRNVTSLVSGQYEIRPLLRSLGSKLSWLLWLPSLI